jgi:hypothetical protein
MLYYYYYVIFLVRTETFMGYGEGAKNPAFHEQDTDH